MSSPQEKNTLIALQEATINLLNSAEKLLQQGEHWLNKPDHYRRLAAIIRTERHKVTTLELRLSIVAPIKAGKSTIANAILGAGVLPTRNSAMTSIPTEITNASDCNEAELTIPDSTLSRFNELWHRLHKSVLLRGIKESQELAPENPELQTLISQLGKSTSAPISARASGIQEVQSTLLCLNDLFRTAALLEGPHFLSGIKDFELPRIKACFLRSAPSSVSQHGTLVIVDTPGPNEARQHHLLEQVIAEQLERTSLVLLVLDFTQLSATAAELVSKEVQAVAQIVGEENIFVIVNKVDERDDKGMTSDQVRQFIIGHLNFKKPIPSSRIFEVSAKRAFRSADFLREYKQDPRNGDHSLGSWPAAVSLAPLVFGATQWEEDLEETTSDELARRAGKLWARSGFDTFLTQAIEKLLAEVAPRALRVALTVARAHLTILRNDARMRHKAIRANAASVESELKNLDQEIRNLEESRRCVDLRIKEVEKDLREHLGLLRRRLQPIIEEDVRLVFKEKEDTDASAIQGFLKRGKRFVARHFGDPLGGVSRAVEFENLADAQEFANYAVDLVLGRIRPQIELALDITNRRVEATRREFEQVLATETRPILQRAAERIKRHFDVTLEFPRPKLANPLEKISIARRVTKFEPGGVEVRTRYETRWYTFFLWEHEVNYSVKTKDRYIISLDEVAQQVKQTAHQNVEDLSNRFDDFLATDFKDGIDDYFKRLREYFQFYRQTLEEAVQAQRMSLEQRDTALNQLDTLDEESSQSLNELHGCRSALEKAFGGDHLDSPEDAIVDGVDLFISYSHADESFRQDLEKHLSLLRRSGLIHLWHDREIIPGQQWADEIDRHLESSQIIVLLISADFIASDYCFAKEMTRALERHKEGTAVVVPIILRDCDWNLAPFGEIQALPKDGKAIKSWDDRDAALTDVARGLRKAVAHMQKAAKGG
ncbi:TIR domain-containing protein [Pyxidicoccus caerfyrddinensis]|uniref:TIR domain-containing protein n=1 Tax=Pyxidicoccus caerfyrddinensis TaxID=2709663 RepID=UPI0013DCAA04|nr:TIR domain-containing protein [Pyxidicoccus caerfyrddinensis]